VVIVEDHGPLSQSNVGDLVGEMALAKAMMDVGKVGAAKPAP
jgi:hypothetical protein